MPHFLFKSSWRVVLGTEPRPIKEPRTQCRKSLPWASRDQ